LGAQRISRGVLKRRSATKRKITTETQRHRDSEPSGAGLASLSSIGVLGFA
jgi:hypothetical protein